MANELFSDLNGLHDENYIVTPKTKRYEEMPEYTEIIEKALLEYFKDGFDKYNETLIKEVHKDFYLTDDDKLETIRNGFQENNAIISGGFMLKSIGLFKDPKSIDADIYVPAENGPEFKEEFSKLFAPTNSVKHEASNQPGVFSFLKKNGIKSVEKYSKEGPHAEMDIVEVVKTPIEVVQNFDLTFCQIWYDGKTVYASFPEHIKNKSGFLQNDYVQMYMAGNQVTKKRMLKYINRGFQISIKFPNGNTKDVTEDVKKNMGQVTNGLVTNALVTNALVTNINKPINTTRKKYNKKNPKSITEFFKEEIDLIVTKIEQKPLTNINRAKRLGGSTGAYLFVKKGEPGNFWVVKRGGKDKQSNFGGGLEQIKSESLTNDIYEAAGVRVPAHRLDGESLILEYINGFMLINEVGEPEFNSIKEDLCKHFVIDVLVANYDVIGAGYDNIMLPSDGSEAVRIDNGAGLTYRAMGRFKTEFDGSVGKELDKNGIYRSDTNQKTPIQTIFSDLTDQQIAKQILEQFTPEKKEKILSVIPEGLPGLPSSDPPLMKDIIRERIEYMIEWANEPQHKPINGGRRTKKKRSTKCKRRTLKFKHGRHRAA